MKKLVLILVLLFGISSVSFAMGSAPSAQAGNAQVEETQFIPRPVPTPRTPAPAVERVRPGGLLPQASNSVLVKYVEDLITYAPQDPLPGTKVIITNDPFNPIWLSERVTQGLGTAVAGIATFPGLTVRESIWIIAYHEGFRPEILPGVRVVNTSAYAYPGAAHHFSLVLPRINPFTSEMLRSTRNAKISVFEERPPRVAGGEWISVGSEGARVIITKQSGRRVYGLEPPATATGSNGIISGLALPDTGVDEAASGTLPPGAFGPTLYTIYAYKSGYYMAWMDGAAETLFSDRGVTLYLKKPHR